MEEYSNDTPPASVAVPSQADESSNMSVTSNSAVSDIGPRRLPTRNRPVVVRTPAEDDCDTEIITPNTQPVSNEGASEANVPIETWEKLEQILKVRRVAPIPEHPENLSWNEKVSQFEFFAKYHDQSFWHCNWISARKAIALNRNMVVSYFRKNPDAVDKANEQYLTLRSDENSRDLFAKVPSPDADDDESVLDPNARKAACEGAIIGATFYPQNLPRQPIGGRRRFEYYVNNGIPESYLFPETVLIIDKGFIPGEDAKKDEDPKLRRLKRSLGRSKVRLREVLVKWHELGENFCTWETVEYDESTMDLLLPRCRRIGLRLRDQCGRRLIPLFVRDWLLRLIKARLAFEADLLSLHLGTADRERIRECLSRGFRSNTPPPSPNWQEKWTNGQPDYLSSFAGRKLHPYQLEGVRWLRSAYYNRNSVILADEMGLGKTVQVIAFLFSLLKEDRNPGPFLIVGPLTVVANWKEEFGIWAPEMQVLVYVGDTERRAYLNAYSLYMHNKRVGNNQIPNFHVLITNFEQLTNSRSSLSQISWRGLIVDEGHRFKNRGARQFRDVLAYDIHFKVLLTGTPLQNDLVELANLLHFLDPVKFNNPQVLGETWSKMRSEERTDALRSTLKDHLLRRLKRDVHKDLPKKTEVLVPVTMSALQKKLYQLVLVKDYEALRKCSLNSPFAQLQKVCGHPYLLPVAAESAPRLPNGAYEQQALLENSAKLSLVIRMLRRLHERGHRVLLFSHLLSILDLFALALHNEGLQFETLDGRLQGMERQAAIDRFNSPKTQSCVFLLSTRAGGEGINLASADTVILFDSDWNPHRDMQALSRSYRIGQSRHVIVYRLYVRHTVEERVIRVAYDKLALSQGIMGSHGDEQQHLEVALADVESVDSVRAKKSARKNKNTEIFEAITTGLDILFDDDSDDSGEADDNEGKKQAQGDSDVIEVDEEGKADKPDEKADVSPETKEDEKKAKSKAYVYDDKALERLLDREALWKPSTSFTNTVESELIFFRPTTEEIEEEWDAKRRASLSEKEMREAIDKYLKWRHERLMATDSAVVDLLSGAFNDATIADAPAQVDLTSQSDTTAGATVATASAFDGTEDVDDVEIASYSQGGDSLLVSAPNAASSASMKPEPSDGAIGGAASAVKAPSSRFPRRSSRRLRSTLPTTLALMDTDDAPLVPLNDSSGAQLIRRARGDDSDEDFRPDEAELSQAESNDGDLDDDGDDDVGEGRRGRDSNYVPDPRFHSGAAAANSMNSNARLKRSGRSRRGRENLRGEENELIRGTPGEEERRLAELYRQLDWSRNVDKICRPLMEIVRSNSINRVVFTEKNMVVCGFGPHDRQAFLEHLMRFGAPPKGLVPPPEWLPFQLRSKPPEQLFAYTNFFMRHIADDPKTLDSNALYWSDGLPNEGVSGIAVLSRIGMIALIKNKVKEFEDFNLVPNKLKTRKDPSFRFNIYEGGLSLITRIWKGDMERLNCRVGALREVRKRQLQQVAEPTPSSSQQQQQQQTGDAPAVTGDPAVNAAVSTLLTSAETQPIDVNRVWSTIARTWHHRHDYYLLAGMALHGYNAIGEIFKDDMFKIVVLGAAERFMPQEDVDPFATKYTDDEYLAKARELVFKPRGLAFLSERLRWLEQALLVEQALGEMISVFQRISRPHRHSTAGESRAKIATDNRRLLIALSARLCEQGPIKHISIPSTCNSEEKDDFKRAVLDLHLLLEDLYADMPGLPGALVCEGIDFIQPRFLRVDPGQRRQLPETSQPRQSEPRQQQQSSTNTPNILATAEALLDNRVAQPFAGVGISQAGGRRRLPLPASTLTTTAGRKRGSIEAGAANSATLTTDLVPTQPRRPSILARRSHATGGSRINFVPITTTVSVTTGPSTLGSTALGDALTGSSSQNAASTHSVPAQPISVPVSVPVVTLSSNLVSQIAPAPNSSAQTAATVGESTSGSSSSSITFAPQLDSGFSLVQSAPSTARPANATRPLLLLPQVTSTPITLSTNTATAALVSLPRLIMSTPLTSAPHSDGAHRLVTSVAPALPANRLNIVGSLPAGASRVVSLRGPTPQQYVLCRKPPSPGAVQVGDVAPTPTTTTTTTNRDASSSSSSSFGLGVSVSRVPPQSLPLRRTPASAAAMLAAATRSTSVGAAPTSGSGEEPDVIEIDSD